MMGLVSDDANRSVNWTKRLSVSVIVLALVLTGAVFAGQVYNGAYQARGFWAQKKIERAHRVERVKTLQRQAQETREARTP